MNPRPARYLVPTLFGSLLFPLLAVGCSGTEPTEPTQTAAPAEEVGSAAAAVSCDVTFTPMVTYGATARSYTLAEVDLNGDGMPDIAFSRHAAMSVMLNQGDGTFGAQVDYLTGFDPKGVEAVDVNGDGMPDLVFVDDSGLGVMLNQGNGAFAAEVTYPAGRYPGGISVADVNGDGMPDCILFSSATTIDVFLNQGDGTFAAPVVYPAPNSPGTTAAADVNGDGFPDIVVGDYRGLGVMLNQGDGTFAAEVLYPGPTVTSVAVADLDGDGLPDVAASTIDFSSYPLVYGAIVMLNQGNGTFAPAVDYPMLYGSISIKVADMNGDGEPDLVVAEGPNTGNEVDVLLNQGGGIFGAPTSFPMGTYIYEVGLKDLNGDGLPDIAVAQGGGVGVLYNTSCGCTIGGTPYAPGDVNPANTCEVCTPATSTTAWSGVSDGTACSDGHACTVGDTCQSGACVGGPISPSCSTVTVTIQRAGASGTVFDAALDLELPTMNNGASSSIPTGLAAGNAGKTRATLMSFDLGVIPPGAYIQSAVATLYTYQSSGSQQTRAHEVTVPWTESTVTWASFPSNGYLAATAATFPGVANILVTAGTLESTQADLTALVQAWYSGATANNGILLEQNLAAGSQSNTGVTAFCSSEWTATGTPADGPTERPALVVTYIPNY